MTGNNTLILFIKNAEKGKVKTRLAQSTGAEKALKIYKALLKHTRDTALCVPAGRHLFYSQKIEKEDEWKEEDFYKHLQEGKDLGERMLNAFEKVYQSPAKMVIIGSDCPGLSPGILEEAFLKLEDYPFVIGPAMDGGYYLLGMQHPAAVLFENINWSTSQVCAATLKKIEAMGKQYFLLPALSDIDYASDWEKYGWEI